jgi:hypothetical protein
MNVLWQDNAASFLDGSSLGGAGGFAASLGDGGAPWFASADGGLFSGQPVLWWDNGADSATAAPGLTGVPGFDPGGAAGGWLPNGAEAFAGADPTLDGGLLWPDGRGSTSNLVLTGAGMGQWNLSAVDAASSQWLQSVRDIASRGEKWLTEASTLLWTGGQPSLTPPITGTPQLAGGLAGPTFPTLTPEHLVWTDPSGATGLTAGPSLGVAEPAPTTLASSLGGPVQSASGLPSSLGGTR